MTSTISVAFEPSEVGAVGCGRENMSLNTGEARERISLWARKSRLGGPGTRRMISASRALGPLSLGIVVVGVSEVVGMVRAWRLHLLQQLGSKILRPVPRSCHSGLGCALFKGLWASRRGNGQI